MAVLRLAVERLVELRFAAARTVVLALLLGARLAPFLTGGIEKNLLVGRKLIRYESSATFSFSDIELTARKRMT